MADIANIIFVRWLVGCIITVIIAIVIIMIVSSCPIFVDISCFAYQSNLETMGVCRLVSNQFYRSYILFYKIKNIFKIALKCL